MQLGMIGLGRMGANMVRRLLRGGVECAVFNRSPRAVEELVQEKATGAANLQRSRHEAQESPLHLAHDPRCRRLMKQFRIYCQA